MLEQSLTTERCSQIVSMLLRKRGWTIARIARATGTSTDYVRRVQHGEHSFQIADVEAIAKACKQQPHRLIFDSFDREKLLPHMRRLYDLTQKEIERHATFQRVLRKPTKKRKSSTKAA